LDFYRHDFDSKRNYCAIGAYLEHISKISLQEEIETKQLSAHHLSTMGGSRLFIRRIMGDRFNRLQINYLFLVGFFPKPNRYSQPSCYAQADVNPVSRKPLFV
jgi:hypothetical protein